MNGKSTYPELRREIDWAKSVPFILMHLGAFSVFFVPFSWSMVGLCLALYYVRMFGVTAGYHRYFSHRTYKLNRFWQFMMALLASSSMQKGVLWWAAHHRYHHQHSDQPDDIHSPKQQGFLWSHVGWVMGVGSEETREDLIRDFAKFPELRWLDRHKLVSPLALGGLIFASGGLPALAWGWALSTVILWHGTFTINSLSHVFGSIRYRTTDTSKNNFLLALITMGEGWHNNHHCYMVSANQGFYWWEWDPSFYLLWLGEKVGIVKDLRRAPVEKLKVKRLDHVTQKSNTSVEPPEPLNSTNSWVKPATKAARA